MHHCVRDVELRDIDRCGIDARARGGSGRRGHSASTHRYSRLEPANLRLLCPYRCFEIGDRLSTLRLGFRDIVGVFGFCRSQLLLIASLRGRNLCGERRDLGVGGYRRLRLPPTR